MCDSPFEQKFEKDNGPGHVISDFQSHIDDRLRLGFMSTFLATFMPKVMTREKIGTNSPDTTQIKTLFTSQGLAGL